VLLRDQEGVAACRQDPHLRTAVEDTAHHCLDRVPEVLAVVEDQKEVAVGQVRDERLVRRPCGAAQAEGRHGGVRHQARVLDRCQLDDLDPVGVDRGHVRGDPRRESGLSHAAWTGEGHHAGAPQGLANLDPLVSAAHEGGELGR